MSARQILPDDHDCEACGCVFPEHGWHQDEWGLCLGCGGCGDNSCCQHDDSCRFEIRPSVGEALTPDQEKRRSA